MIKGQLYTFNNLVRFVQTVFNVWLFANGNLIFFHEMLRPF